MKTLDKICTKCGVTFQTKKHVSRCPECQREYRKEYLRTHPEIAERKREQAALKRIENNFIRHKVTKSELNITEANRKALAEGMTYGKYSRKMGW